MMGEPIVVLPITFCTLPPSSAGIAIVSSSTTRKVCCAVPLVKKYSCTVPAFVM